MRKGGLEPSRPPDLQELPLIVKLKTLQNWHVALMRHDKIATGPGNYRYSDWLRGLAFPATVVVQRRTAASLLASIDGPPRSVSRRLAAHVNLDLTRPGFFTRRQANRQYAVLVFSGDLRCIDR